MNSCMNIVNKVNQECGSNEQLYEYCKQGFNSELGGIE